MRAELDLTYQLNANSNTMNYTESTESYVISNYTLGIATSAIEACTFFDGAKFNTDIRYMNVELLKGRDYVECSAKSRSGECYVTQVGNKVVFGKSCNSGGRYTKHYSLCKKFKTYAEAVAEFEAVKAILIRQA